MQHALPLTDIAKKELQFELGKNVVAVGAISALFGLDPEYIRRLLHQRFARKGEEILDKNYQALAAGIGYVERNIPERGTLQVKAGTLGDTSRIVVSGNQAIAMGSLAAGCRSTPATRSPRPRTSWSSWPRSCRRWAAPSSRPKTRCPRWAW